jgi:Na+-translocating ferredoxin:NAD+ oxidoreductase subunit G
MNGHVRASAAQPQRPDVKSAKLVGTLAGFGAIAGLLIVVAFEWAQPRILADKAAVLQNAVGEVLGAPDRIQSLFLIDGKLVDTPPAGVDTTKVERVFAGYDSNGRTIGYAIIGAQPGFADVVNLIFGYDPVTKQLLGMKVLDNKETPGLGDKIVKDTSFVAEFRRAATPLRGVKHGAGKGGKEEIDMITGVTISSRTVIAIINKKLKDVEPLLMQYREKKQ